MDYAHRANELFVSGCNCSQAVFCTFAPELGIDEKTALILAAGFGGGMGRMREVCGAVSGMIMAASMKFASDDPKDAAAKGRLYEIIRALAGEFKEKNGSIICRELLNLPSDEAGGEPCERTQDYYKKRPCAMLCADAAKILGDFCANCQKI